MTAKRLSAEEALALYRKMLEVRAFEDQIQKLFATGEIRGSTHLCQGQEAVSVGFCSQLRQGGDTMVCTYRGHGAVLAMGASLEASFAEILGKGTGLCRGKGGSMHLADVERGILGSFAIVGAGLPIANGAALTSVYLGRDDVSVAFFGDGATNIGTFHEALNLAATWRLPVIFACENNLYGEYSPLRTTTPVADLSKRADSYGMPGIQVDGNDLLEVRRVAGEAIQRARSGGGPTLVEALTYRHHGHSRSDPGTYRPDEEVQEWRARDPILRFEGVLKDRYGINSSDLEAARQEVKESVTEALAKARVSEEPDLSTLTEDVYV